MSWEGLQPCVWGGVAALCVGRGCSCVYGEGLQLCELGGVAALRVGRGCSTLGCSLKLGGHAWQEYPGKTSTFFPLS